MLLEFLFYFLLIATASTIVSRNKHTLFSLSIALELETLSANIPLC